MLKQFADESASWFELESIHAREKWISDLLMRSKEDIICDQEDFLTFLTQKWQESRAEDKQQLIEFMADPDRLDAELNFKQWIEKRSVWCRARPYTEQN